MTILEKQPLLPREANTVFDRDAYRFILRTIDRAQVEMRDALTGEPAINPFLPGGRQA